MLFLVSDGLGCGLQVAILEKRREACIEKGGVADEAQNLQRHIDQLQKIVHADEAEASRLLSNREAYLWTAVDAFIRQESLSHASCNRDSPHCQETGS